MFVLGGSSAGTELAQAFARLGTRVTLVERGPRILINEDADASGLVHESLERDGVRVITGADTQVVVQQGSLLRVWVEAEGRDREPVDCEVILVATGRLPNIEELGLETAGVAFTAEGVTVNEKLQTSQRHIYAAGDVVGPPRFTHLADVHARTIVRNILTPWWRERVDMSVLPSCVFTSPQVARVGWNEQEAVRRGAAYEVFKQPMESVDRAVVESEEIGFAKLLLAKGQDRILGATIVSERAGELIAEVTLAMTAKLGLSAIGRTIYAYPSFSEVLRQITDQKQKTRLTPFRKKLLSALYRRARA